MIWGGVSGGIIVVVKQGADFMFAKSLSKRVDTFIDETRASRISLKKQIGTLTETVNETSKAVALINGRFIERDKQNG